MKIALPDTPVETSKVFKDVKFGFGDHAVIMEILRGKMYTNPIKTLCQEIMSNARDAHAEIGKNDTPIEVTLPTPMDMHIRIRDFGPGITPDRMADVFVLYGSSTKRADDSQVGGWGLGAKSPFAYSDTFSVVSNTPDDAGQMWRREYIAYIDQSRIGVMSLVKEEVTTEAQGTTVIVPVKGGDTWSFAEHVRNAGRYWKVKPSVLPNGSAWYWGEPAYSYEGSNWALAAKREHGGLIVIEGISYPLDINRIADQYSAHGVRKIGESGIILHFKTGDLLITANREAVDLQPNIVAKIAVRLQEAYDELKTWINKKVSSATTYVEALNLYREFKHFGISAKWKGVEIKNETINLSERARVSRYHREERATNGFTRQKIDRYNRGAYFSIELNDLLNKATLVVENDGYSLGRIAGVFKNSPDVQELILVDFKSPNDRKVINEASNWDQFGFVKLGTFEKVKLTFSTPNTAGTKIPILKAFNSHSNTWQVSTKDPAKDSGVYVVLAGGKPFWQGKPTTMAFIHTLTMRLELAEPICGVHGQRLGRLGAGWVPAETYVRAKITEIEKKLNLDKIISSGDALDEHFSGSQRHILEKVIKLLPDGHLLKQWALAAETSQAMRKVRDSLYNIKALLNENDANNLSKQSQTSWYRTVDAAYPLLFLSISGLSWSNPASQLHQHLSDYIMHRDALAQLALTQVPAPSN